MIVFDRLDTWGDDFADRIERLCPELKKQIGRNDFEYIEDAGDFVIKRMGLLDYCTFSKEWISSNLFSVYHGTRILDEELESVRSFGLKPLLASSRRARLDKIFEDEEIWKGGDEKVDYCLDQIGP